MARCAVTASFRRGTKLSRISNPALFVQPAERGLGQRSALSLPITNVSQTSVWI
jgi:hypothetical protein